MFAKSFLLSKTFWFNVVAVLVLILNQFGYVGELDPEWQGYVDVFVPALVAVINIALRFITKQPIALSRP